ncbi:acyltransferase family protein [Sphingomonas sp. 8AM]|uniref:acyltransferase family protein n=1 Tax=Sphingomonas sp. 8AM TaxID=2653170 RepID=UPI0012F0A683|nr:acyltransferase [Sphingomonas sp. 8AM]VXC98849.1 Surface polysaccharide O-acyltransferase, integral membrane enzyme [Sphingomonas sp. 8AM]
MTKPTQCKAPPRNAGIDLLRILMTALVILHHTAIAYGGSGGWFWREQPNASNPLLVMFNAINQSYFMGLFFLFAGYYTPLSIDRKGLRLYLADRLVRLGVPLFVFFFVLHPLTVALADTGTQSGLLQRWRQGIIDGPHGPGPLWFAIALLIFALAYTAWRGLLPEWLSPPKALPRRTVILLAIVAMGLVTFAVRLVIPVGREILWLQLGYFPSYIALFALGIAAARNRLLEQVTMRIARPWLALTLAALASLPLVVASQGAAGGFEGGMNRNALYYALWEPCVATGVILGLLAWANRRRHTAAPMARWLAASAFGAFILHPPVLVALGVLASSWSAAPLIKFLVIGAAACGASFAIAGASRLIPAVRRII